MISVILAAGKGKRLGSLSDEKQKSSLIINKNIILLSQISKKIYIVVGHRKEDIFSEVKKLSKELREKIFFVEQKEQNGSATAVSIIESKLGEDDKQENILVCNGDTLLNLEIIKKVSKSKNNCLLAYTIDDPWNYGVLKIDKKNILEEVIEKPTKDEIKENNLGNFVNAGIYIFPFEIFDAIRETPINKKRNEYEITDSIMILNKEKPFEVIEIKKPLHISNEEDLKNERLGFKNIIESFSGIRVELKYLREEKLIDYANCFALFLNGKNKIVIGRDSRNSGKNIAKILIKFFTERGFLVYYVDIIPTPAIEFAIRETKSDGGIIITASHNPEDYNGLKFCKEDGSQLTKDEFEKMISYKNSELIEKKKGDWKNLRREIEKRYVKFILGFLKPEARSIIKAERLNLIIDLNGSSASRVISELVKELKFNAKIINKKFGQFEHKIEPTEDALEELISLCKEKNTAGATFDCDSDRLALITEKGKYLSGNEIFALGLINFLKANRSRVVINNMTSYIIKDICNEAGIKIYETDVGECNVVEAMKAKDCLVGGEGSSGGFILWPSRCRDGILSLLIILDYMCKENKTLHDLYEELPKRHYKKGGINKKIENLNDKLEDWCMRNNFNFKNFGKNAGFKIMFTEDIWVAIRSSQTEPSLIRIAVDSKSEAVTEKLTEKMKTVLEGF